MVGEPHLGARVHRIDGHLAIGGAGDLNPAIVQAGPSTGDAPIRILANAGGLGQEVRHLARGDAGAALAAGGETLTADAGEAVVQCRNELKGLGREDVVESGLERAGDRDAAAGRGGPLGERIFGQLSGRVVGGGRGDSHDRGPFSNRCESRAVEISGTVPIRSNPRAQGWRFRD